MSKVVIFSDDAAVLLEERNVAFNAGVRVQLRDVKAYSADWKPDGQFKAAQAVMRLSAGVGEGVAERAADIKARYTELGVTFHSSVAELLKAQGSKPTPTTTKVVAGVDTPGPGTVEHMKGVTAKRVR